MSDMIDKEINSFLKESYDRAKEILIKHRVSFSRTSCS